MTIEKAQEIMAELNSPDPRPFDFKTALDREMKYTPAEYDEAYELVGPLSQFAADLRRAESTAWIARMEAGDTKTAEHEKEKNAR